MTDAYPDGFIGCQLNVLVEPPLDEGATVDLVAGLKAAVARFGIALLSRKKEERRGREESSYRLRNGEDLNPADELIVGVSADRVMVIWGGNTDLERALEIVAAVAETLVKHVPTVRIERYNCEIHLEVAVTGSGFERIAQAVYDGGVIGAFYRAMTASTPDFRVGDNDVQLTFLLGESRTGMIRLTSATSDREILQDTFDDDPLRLFLGVQEVRIPDTGEAFTAEVVAHAQRVNEIARREFQAAIVVRLQALERGNDLPN